MNSDLTDITLVVDRSGSIAAIQQEAETGINTFIEKQARQPGEALISLVQFDTDYEFVHRGVPARDVPPYQLAPRGLTALLDAVGRAITETGKRLAAMDEAERPGLVIFVIVTDGLENASHEFTRAKIREMITHQQERYAWQFTFLGANQDAFTEAESLGISAMRAATYDPGLVAQAYGSASAMVSRARSARRAGANEDVDAGFTQDELDSLSQGSSD